MTRTMSLGWRLLVALIVAVGIAVAWGVGMVWFGGLVDQATRARDYYEQLYVSLDGEPVILRMSMRTSAQEQVRTLAGQPKQVSSQELLYPHHVTGPDRETYVVTPGWEQRLSSVNDGGAPATYWYLVHDGGTPGRAYGIGYHSLTRKVVGYFGRSGFTDSIPPRDDWFQVASQYGLTGAIGLSYGAIEPAHAWSLPHFLLLADGKLWLIDVAQRQVRSLVESPAAYRVGQAWQMLAEVPAPPPGVYRQAAQSITPQATILRQPDSILLLNPTRDEHKTIPLPDALQGETLAVFVLPDDNVLLITQPQRAEVAHKLVWLNPSGQVLREQQVRLGGYWKELSLAAIAWRAVAVAPVPAGLGVAALAAPIGLVEQGEADSYSAALGQLMGEAWPTFFAVLALGIACAVGAYRRQKRFALPYAAAWAVFAFFLGVPGWLAYRFHRAWPVMEGCPACGQSAPLDRHDCVECGTAFPPPPLKGTEVFA